MRINKLALHDQKQIPFEEILRLIREGKLKSVTIEWSGAANADNPHHYTVTGEVETEVFIRGFGLEKK